MKPVRIASRLFALLYPQRCVFCERVIAPDEDCCPACEETVPKAYALSRLPIRDRAVYCVTPYAYHAVVRSALIRFKFYGKQSYARFFSHQIVAALQETGLIGRFSVVTAVPLSRGRLRERGYNQSVLLAREVARLLEIPYEKTLKKPEENLPQHNLTADRRRRNVLGVYRPEARVKAEGKRYLLVDDILTTGETLAECTRCLFRMGAGGVVCAAVAKAGKIGAGGKN